MTKEEVEKFLLDKAQRCINEGMKLTKERRTSVIARGHNLISAGQVVMEIWHEDKPDFEERAKAVFLHVGFV